jgi:hypothetical protein
MATRDRLFAGVEVEDEGLTVEDYLRNQVETYVELLRDHAELRIREFELEAKRVRAQISALDVDELE